MASKKWLSGLQETEIMEQNLTDRLWDNLNDFLKFACWWGMGIFARISLETEVESVFNWAKQWEDLLKNELLIEIHREKDISWLHICVIFFFAFWQKWLKI